MSALKIFVEKELNCNTVKNVVNQLQFAQIERILYFAATLIEGFVVNLRNINSGGLISKRINIINGTFGADSKDKVSTTSLAWVPTIQEGTGKNESLRISWEEKMLGHLCIFCELVLKATQYAGLTNCV